MLKKTVHKVDKILDYLMEQDTLSYTPPNTHITTFERKSTEPSQPQKELNNQNTNELRTEIITTLTQESFIKTNDPLNAALMGAGYFTVETSQGIRYSRNGSFNFNAKGILVNSEGHPLVSKKGTIKKNPSDKGILYIKPNGAIFIGDLDKGQLLIAHFSPNAEIEKQRDSYSFLVSGKVVSGNSTVLQGFLENSTVYPLNEITGRENSYLHFKAKQKSLKKQAEALRRITTLMVH